MKFKDAPVMSIVRQTDFIFVKIQLDIRGKVWSNAITDDGCIVYVDPESEIDSFKPIKELLNSLQKFPDVPV